MINLDSFTNEKNKNEKKRHANANDMENMQKSVIRESTTN